MTAYPIIVDGKAKHILKPRDDNCRKQRENKIYKGIVVALFIDALGIQS